jgi:hypothetical protein
MIDDYFFARPTFCVSRYLAQNRAGTAFKSCIESGAWFWVGAYAIVGRSYNLNEVSEIDLVRASGLVVLNFGRSRASAEKLWRTLMHFLFL